MHRGLNRLLCAATFSLCVASSFALGDVGVCKTDAENPTQVVIACSKIIDLPEVTEKELAQALLDRAEARRQLLSQEKPEQYNNAISDVVRALEIVPESSYAHYLLAGIHQKVRNFEEAIVEYDRALSIDGDVAASWIGRGLAYMGLNAPLPAIRDFERAIALEPNKADGYYARAMAHFALKDHALGLADLDRALDLKPNNLDLLLTRAGARTAVHDFEGAIADYSTFIKSGNAGPEAYYQRGLIYELSRDYERAADDFEAAIQIDPNNTKYARALERMIDLLEEK